MWIMVLPLRLGEFARPLFLEQKTDIGFGQALGTVAIERVVDGLFVCGAVLRGSCRCCPRSAASRPSPSIACAASGCSPARACSRCWWSYWPWPWRRARVGRLVAATLGRLVPPLADKLEGLARSIAEGLAALPSIAPLLKFLAGTVAYWAPTRSGPGCWPAAAASTSGFPEALAMMSVLGISLLIPGGPGQFGMFHYGMILGLACS